MSHGNLYCRCGSILLLWVLLDTFLRYTKWLSWMSLLGLKVEIGTSVDVGDHMILDPWRVCVFGTRPTHPKNVFKYECGVMNDVFNDFRERLCNGLYDLDDYREVIFSSAMMTDTRSRYFRLDFSKKEKSSFWYHRFLMFILIDQEIEIRSNWSK